MWNLIFPLKMKLGIRKKFKSYDYGCTAIGNEVSPNHFEVFAKWLLSRLYLENELKYIGQLGYISVFPSSYFLLILIVVASRQ